MRRSKHQACDAYDLPFPFLLWLCSASSKVSHTKGCSPWLTFRIKKKKFCSGRGKGESETPRGEGIGFLVKTPGRGGGVPGGGGGRGAGRVSAANWGFGGGGGGKYFFSGPKRPPSHIAIFFACYGGLLGPSGPKKSFKKVRTWVLGPGARKCRKKKSQKESKRVKKK